MNDVTRNGTRMRRCDKANERTWNTDENDGVRVKQLTERSIDTAAAS